MRDLLVFAIVMFCLPMAFKRPFIGLLLFSWLAYMRPQDLCWGFARSMRFSFLAGMVMIVGWWVHESRVRKFWKPDARTIAMLSLVVVVTVGLYLAPMPPLRSVAGFDSPYVARYYFEFVKIVAVALFTTGQVDTKQRLRTLLWTICLCLAFFGVKGGLLGILSGGSPILRGPGGMLEDNNDFALAMVMNIPLMFYLGKAEQMETIKWMRQATIAAIALTMVTVLLTHSRGAFLAAVVTLMIMAWRSGKLFQASAVLIFLASVFFLLAPNHVVERIASIGEGGEESSAGARLRAWGAALSMVDQYPIFGVGLRQFQYHFKFHAGPAAAGGMSYVAHNSYLQIWAENGTIALIIYMGLLGSVFWACRYVRKLGKMHPNMPWIGLYARMMEATTIGFMCGAFFLNRGHFDLIYHWFALTSCLLLVARKEVLHSTEEVASPEEAGVEVRWRNGGAATGPPGATGPPAATWAPLAPTWGR